jgi:DNA-binding CsgD family transcriptional regulator
MTDASERPSETLALTPPQRDILVLVVNGLTNREIADRLGLAPGRSAPTSDASRGGSA